MWTSAQVLLVKAVLYVKMFPAVTNAFVNQDLQAGTVKEVLWTRETTFFRQTQLSFSYRLICDSPIFSFIVKTNKK